MEALHAWAMIDEEAIYTEWRKSHTVPWNNFSLLRLNNMRDFDHNGIFNFPFGLKL